LSQVGIEKMEMLTHKNNLLKELMVEYEII
jgi:hypothetical protein